MAEKILLYGARAGDDKLSRIGAPMKTPEAAAWAVRRLGEHSGYEHVAAITAHSNYIVATWPPHEACDCGCRE